MTQNENLRARAINAALAYYRVHGSYPKQLGIHHEQWPVFCRQYGDRIILFDMEQPPHLFTEQELIPGPSSGIRSAMIVPIAGARIVRDEIYVPVPGNPLNALTTGAIIKMAENLARRIDTETLQAIAYAAGIAG